MSDSIQSKSSAVDSPADLPPPRNRKGMRHVSPPLSNTPLHRIINYVVFFAVLLLGFYSWRLFQWKTEVGGWWNLALGKRPPGADAMYANAGGNRGHGNGDSGDSKDRKHLSVEARIEELAAALGMASSDLAVAIADAVREHVPPASLSSVSAHEPSGTAVKYLVNPSGAAKDANSVSGGVEAVASAFEAAVGFDEPASELHGD